jgi:protein tyrosine/serine phosphatase
MTQKHHFEGIENFRDFGGYQAGGRRLARGRFFRSGGHSAATDADLHRLSDLGITTIVDLRRPEERERAPSRRWRGFDGTVLENHDDREGEYTWTQLVSRRDLTADHFRDYLVTYHRNAPYVPRHIDIYTRYFAALAEGEGGLLVHCAAGKDRTGLIVALTHTLAGVHQDDIVHDFLLSNDEARFDRRAPAFANAIEAEHGYRPPLAALKAGMGVEAHYLDGAFAEIRARHGSIDGYLRDVLSVDDAKRERIEARLFE